MSDAGPVDRVQEFESHLKAADRFKRRRNEAIRLLQNDPARYLPLVFAFATENQDIVGKTAGALLQDVLKETEDVKLLLLAYRLFPERSASLSPIAAVVGEKLLQKQENGELALGEAFSAILQNNRAEWLDDCGRADESLRVAEDGVLRLRIVVNREPRFQKFLAISLMTFAKRLSHFAEHTKAQETAREAVHIASTIDGNDGKDRLACIAQANMSYAAALNKGGERRKALSPARAACKAFVELDREGANVKIHWAFACHTYANCLTEFGRHRQSLPFAQKAYDLFWSFAADNPETFREIYLAAANTLSINLAHHGEPGQAARVVGRYFADLRDLARRFPKRFARDYVSCLITYSASQGEDGHLGIAQKAAKLALIEARKLRRIFGEPDLVLEGSARANLFNREYDLGNFRAAKQHAKIGLHLFEQLKKPHPARVFHVAQALRSLAEVSRVTAKSNRELAHALGLAKRGERTIASVPEPRPEALMELSAFCSTTVALCYADAGKFDKAARAEEASLENRRTLFSRSPKVYRRGLAFSLCSMARYELELAASRFGLALIREALRHYSYLTRNSKEHVWMFHLRAMRIKAEILSALNRKRGALHCLEQAIMIFRERLNGPGKLIALERDQLFREYASLAAVVGKPRGRNLAH